MEKEWKRSAGNGMEKEWKRREEGKEEKGLEERKNNSKKDGVIAPQLSTIAPGCIHSFTEIAIKI